MSESEPVQVLYFYVTRWGAHDEFVRLFRKNHWPILEDQLKAGRFTDVRHVRRPASTATAAPTGTSWCRSPTATGRRWRRTARRRSPGACSRTRRRTSAEEARRFELLQAHWDVPLEARPL